MPIETAPRDRDILVRVEFTKEARWMQGKFSHMDESDPLWNCDGHCYVATHWAPLPTI